MSDGFNWDSEIPTEQEIENINQTVSTKKIESAPVHAEQEQEVDYVEESQDYQQDQADDYEFLTNARLRLEQGRLYEMFLKHNLFGDVDSDPRAVANVQKELKEFIQERLEVLLGLKPDPKLVKLKQEETGPFNSLEIDILKKVIGRISGGATEQSIPMAASNKSDTLKTLSAPKTSTIRPLAEVRQPNPRNQQQKQNVRAQQEKKSTPQVKATPAQEPASRPNKPLSEWTPAEKAERNKQIAIEQAAKKAPPGKNHVPMPSFDQQVLYYGSQSNKYAGNGLVGKIIQSLPKGDR